MKELYTLNLDLNNYVLSVAHTQNDNIELDLAEIDLSYLTCYQLINNKLVLDETKKAQLIEQENKKSLAQELSQCESRLKELDYIGVKIATGRATKEEYLTEIEEMSNLANRINEIREVLR